MVTFGKSTVFVQVPGGGVTQFEAKQGSISENRVNFYVVDEAKKQAQALSYPADWCAVVSSGDEDTMRSMYYRVNPAAPVKY